MKLKTITALLFASSMVLTGCNQADQSVNKSSDILKRAESYFQQGQYAAASIEARNALKEDANNLNARLLIARIYFEQGNYGQSVKTLLELPQNNIEVIELLGKNYLYQAKYKSLENLLKSASTITGAQHSWELGRLQALVYLQQGNLEQAKRQIDQLAAAASSQEQKAAAEVVRSLYFGKQNDGVHRLQALEQALTYAPSDIDALLEKAKLQYAQKNYEAAEDLLSQALIALPRTDTMTLKRLEVLQAMTSTLSRQNRSGEAMIYSKLIAEANPKAQELQNEFERGIEKLKSGDLKEAETIFSKLYLTDHARLAGSVLGLIKFQQGDYKGAESFLQDTIDPETASPEVLRAFAESQLRMRNPQQALKTIESNIQEHPDDPDILSVYGLALLATGDTAKGIATLQRVLALEPKRAVLRLALANAYNAQGQPEKALQESERAYADRKDDLSIQERLAMQYAMMGKTTELTRLARELSQAKSVESQALAGLILLRIEPQTGNRLLDELYARSPSEPAVLRAQLRKYALAKDFSQVVRIGKLLAASDNNDLGALGAITEAYARMNQNDLAQQYLKQLSDQSASAWGPDFILANLAFRAQDWQQATSYINKAVSKSGYNAVSTRLYSQIYLTRASGLAQAGQYDDARDLIMEAMQNNEVSPALLHLLIRVELAEGNLAEAEKVMAELGALAPDSQLSHHALGDIAATKGDKVAARTHYQNAWTLGPSDVLGADMWKLLEKASPAEQEEFLAEWRQKLPKSVAARNITGLRLQETGKSADAIKVYEESLAINGFQPVILNNLAWLLMEANRLGEAFTQAEKAVAMAGNNASILDTFGWIAFKAGKKDVALANLEKALQLQPDNEEIKAHLDAVKAR